MIEIAIFPSGKLRRAEKKLKHQEVLARTTTLSTDCVAA
jgi:hypothetical protein